MNSVKSNNSIIYKNISPTPISSTRLHLPIISKSRSTNDISKSSFFQSTSSINHKNNKSVYFKINGVKVQSSKSKSRSKKRKYSLPKIKTKTIPEMIKESKEIVKDIKLFYRKMVLGRKKKKIPKSPFPKMYEHYLDIEASPSKHVETDDEPEEIDEEKELIEKREYIKKLVNLLKYIEDTPANQLDKDNFFETAPVFSSHDEKSNQDGYELMEKLRRQKKIKEKNELKMRAKENERKKLINIYKINPDYCERQKQIKRNDKIVYDENFKLSDYQNMLIDFVGKNARRELMTDMRRNLEKIYNLSNDVFIDNFVKPKKDWDYFIEEIEGSCPRSLLEKLKSFSKSQVAESLKKKREEVNRREREERKGFLNEVREERIAKEKAEKLKKKLNMLRESNLK